MPIAQRAASPERSALAPATDRALLERSLQAGLGIPVAALRASVEGLCSELRGLRPSPAAIPGVLEEVERLGRNVAGLVELARPAEPRPISCRLEEILRSASRAFVPFRRPRLVLARTERGAAVVTDGPLLARALERLVENGLEASDEDDVLLVARREPERVRFAVLNRSRGWLDPQWAMQPFHTTKPNRLGLGLTLAERDVRALGGRLRIETSALGDVRAEVLVPLAPRAGGEEGLAA